MMIAVVRCVGLRWQYLIRPMKIPQSCEVVADSYHHRSCEVTVTMALVPHRWVDESRASATYR